MKIMLFAKCLIIIFIIIIQLSYIILLRNFDAALCNFVSLFFVSNAC